ncbi:lytic transglycosylase domain-containing protein [Longimicrobium sp.]|uniref:lytic transglycosylase domain-containing protein n=1 Tax=Longimicrobium sp. TaxID=2029185 RepID=UPI002CD79DF2|nr:transglycosylase SLT domain-containing protein [Longimicrobium sp.]HSU16225.1 transglycosylase SLT domain-containing protein [Longimicrobium sp.]
MQSLLLKLQADIEARKRRHWDVLATAKSASLGISLALIAFLLGVRAAEGRMDEGGAWMQHLGAALPARPMGLVDLQKAQIDKLTRVQANSSLYGIPADLAERIEDIANAEGIDPKVAFGLVATESEFNRHAVSPVGAVGYTQLMPSTARFFRPDLEREALFDRDTNLRLGFRFLKTLIDKYHGNLKLALLAYNRGPDRVDSLLRAGEDPDNGYARLVLRDWGKRKR